MTTPPQTTQQGQPNPPARQSLHIPIRVYVVSFIVCVAVLFFVPPPYSALIFLGLFSISLIWGLYRLRVPQTPTPAATLADSDVVLNPAKPRRPLISPKVMAHRNLIAAVCTLVAFGLMIAAAIDFRPVNRQQLVNDGALKFVIGALVLGIAIRFSSRLPALSKATAQALDGTHRLWWLFAGIGTLSMVALAEINGQVFQIAPLLQVSSHIQFLLLVVGCSLIGYGFGGAPPIRAGLRRFAAQVNTERYTVLMLSLILVLAAVLRMWNLDGTIRTLLDELHFSDGIIRIESSPTLRLLTPMSGQSPFTWLYPYWQSFSVALLGHNFVGFRFVSAIIGTLNVFVAYVLGRTLFDRKMALLGALVLATFPPHVHFSRVAIIQIADPLFGSLTLLFTARAIKNNHRLDWAFAGVFLGTTQYFYEGARLLFPPLVIGYVILIALRGQMRGKWRGFLTLLVAAFLIGAPVYYTIYGSGGALFGRFDESGSLSDMQRLFANGITLQAIMQEIQHMLTPFMMFVAHPDIGVYYGGQQALILEYLVPFFLFGAAYLAWRYPALAFMIPLWIVATGLGTGLLRDTLVSSRYHAVHPALALALAAGVRYLLPFFWYEPVADAEGVIRREPRLRRAIPVIAIAVIAVAQVAYYFGPHLDTFNVQVRDSKGYRDGIDAALRSVDLPGNTQIYLIGKPEHDQNVPRNWLGFLSQDGDPTRYFPLKTVSTDTISPKYLLDLPHGVNYAFFVAASDVNTMALIVNTFADVSPAQFSNSAYLPAHKEYVLFFVPSEAVTGERIEKP